MTPLIREATVADADTISALALRSKAHWGYSDEFMRACRDELTYTGKQIADPELAFRICDVDDCIAGFYALERIGSGSFELGALFVDPAFIGHGVGRTLVQHAKATARERGGTTLVIQADPNAREFYVAAGAIETGQRQSASIAGRLLPTFEIDLTAEVQDGGDQLG